MKTVSYNVYCLARHVLLDTAGHSHREEVRTCHTREPDNRSTPTKPDPRLLDTTWQEVYIKTDIRLLHTARQKKCAHARHCQTPEPDARARQKRYAHKARHQPPDCLSHARAAFVVSDP